MGFLWPKYICLSYKITEELSFMTLKSDSKFDKKMSCGLKNDMKNLADFHPTTWKCQYWNFDGILLPEKENVLA